MRRLRLLGTFATVMAVLLTGCATAPKPATSTSSPGVPAITFGLTYTPDVQFAPIYVAEQQGYFAAQGLNVTLRHHGASESLFGALQAGTEQVVFAGGDEMMVARGQGVGVVDFATIYQTYPVVLIVPASSPITSLADLKGHTIGVPGPYGETWYSLLAMLQQAGLRQDQVDIQNIGYTQYAALASNKVDAVVGYVNNDLVRFQQGAVPVRSLPLDPSTAPLIGVGLGATDDLVTNHPETLKALWRAVSQGMQFCIDHPDQAVAISASYVPNLNQPDARSAALATLRATTPLYGNTFGHQDAARWTAMSEFLAAQGLTAKAVPAEQVFSTSVVG